MNTAYRSANAHVVYFQGINGEKRVQIASKIHHLWTHADMTFDQWRDLLTAFGGHAVFQDAKIIPIKGASIGDET